MSKLSNSISFSKLEHFLYFGKGRQEERGAKYKSGLRSKSCSFSRVSIVQSSNRVLLSSQFELNLPFQGHVKEESAPCTLLPFFPLPDVITKIIPTTSLLLRNLKKRELFQKSEVLFQLLILLSAYQRISCQSHFQREVARKLLNAEEREEAMLS